MSAPQGRGALSRTCLLHGYTAVEAIQKNRHTSPTIRQMTFGSAVAPFQKLEKGMIITVAAITIPMIPWKAKE